jgi:hypothetical protein
LGAFPPGHRNFLQRIPLWIAVALVVLVTVGIVALFSAAVPSAGLSAKK